MCWLVGIIKLIFEAWFIVLFIHLVHWFCFVCVCVCLREQWAIECTASIPQVNWCFVNRGHCVSMWDGYCTASISLPCSNCNAGKLYCYSNRVEVLVCFHTIKLRFLSSLVMEISFHFIFWLLMCFAFQPAGTLLAPWWNYLWWTSISIVIWCSEEGFDWPSFARSPPKYSPCGR